LFTDRETKQTNTQTDEGDYITSLAEVTTSSSAMTETARARRF